MKAVVLLIVINRIDNLGLGRSASRSKDSSFDTKLGLVAPVPCICGDGSVGFVLRARTRRPAQSISPQYA
jgi:hypothetical protein